MERRINLRLMLRIVAVIELAYALIGTLTPPGSMTSVTDWVLTADGQWLAKLFSMALASQAYLAWSMRKEPHLAVAKAFAFYQLASATVDWLMWIVLADQQVFSMTTGQVLVIASIATHYTLGLLLVLAIRGESRAARRTQSPAQSQAAA